QEKTPRLGCLTPQQIRRGLDRMVTALPTGACLVSRPYKRQKTTGTSHQTQTALAPSRRPQIAAVRSPPQLQRPPPQLIGEPLRERLRVEHPAWEIARHQLGAQQATTLTRQRVGVDALDLGIVGGDPRHQLSETLGHVGIKLLQLLRQAIALGGDLV